MIKTTHTDCLWRCGTSKADITGFVKGAGMMGYGMHFNTVKGVDTPISARAYVLQDVKSGKKMAYICAEICFISLSVRDGVLKRLARHHSDLGLDASNVMFTAQHTHSGPGGFSHYGFYNLTIPGFVPEVYHTIVEGITAALLAAHANLEPARLFLTQGEFSSDLEVAFNRSLKAYNLNPEVKPLREDEAHLGVDRTMVLLRLENAAGKPLGLINWFGVHTTSISNDNHLIHPDNKGFASAETEAHFASINPHFVGAFAQEAAGDVTPNFIWDKKKKWVRGKFENDFESARFNGHLQATLALQLMTDRGEQEIEITSGLDGGLVFADLSKTICDPAFTGGINNITTSAACHGISFFEGTREGPGMPRAVAVLAKGLSRIVKYFELATLRFSKAERQERIRHMYESQWPKDILVEAGSRRVLATPDVKNLFLPGFVDKSLSNFKKHHRSGGLDKKPWVPQVLPLQILTIGQVALVAIPGEITTVGGRRLRSMLLETLSPKGITRVILCPYANAYCGYITTPEEYMAQQYEAGHTVFGRYTLAAFMTHFQTLAREISSHETAVNSEHPTPVRFSAEELAPRMYKETLSRKARKPEPLKV